MAANKQGKMHMNLVLADTEEFRRVKRKSKPAAGPANAPLVESEEKRTLGLTITPLHDLEQASQAQLLPLQLSPPVLESANPLDVVYLLDSEALLPVLEDPRLLLAASLVSPLVVSQERRHRDSLAVERLREDLLVSLLPQDLLPRVDLRPGSNLLQDFSLRARDVDSLHQDLGDGEARMSSGKTAYNIPTPSETWRPTSVGIRNTHPIHIHSGQLRPAIIPQSVTPGNFSNCLPVSDHSPLPSLPQSPVKMAAAIKAINAKIRSNKVLDYVCSTHFWGPVSNFGIPVAAVMDTQKDPEIISGQMTGALVIYSATFMRYALAVSPKNYLLFACHAINFSAQCTQGYRYLNYWNWGGREAKLAAEAALQGSQAPEAGA
ncbi:hypothetical protein ANOM_000891 [Aspergillus nomiae NRRL 13137]|uniref:Mitochondrial pyruvate carrier n=1 Tax=Aspergillus nomiae NRRL (strain ATCC 15546 / NRRL 13137 / CBS 260.88 / M93) TaxID=1509407 RepID=A0A0L1JG87_ASPN3|nr:uncharacterized protein ANOM_000891 [Aspergillus nomiae NRRL 13137]KNG90779.1 hypothetical protein ANOM_000891 [Aspergillus nomiae NRRL 13137]